MDMVNTPYNAFVCQKCGKICEVEAVIDNSTPKPESEGDEYHKIERILNNFSNGETYTKSIDDVQAIITSFRQSLLQEVREKVRYIKPIGYMCSGENHAIVDGVNFKCKICEENNIKNQVRNEIVDNILKELK